MYSGDVWRADSTSDRDVKTFARLTMREKLISLDSCVKILNTDKRPCPFFFFLRTVPSGFSLGNPLLLLEGCFHPAPTLPDKRLNEILPRGKSTLS